jgi:hypothetical protein
LRGYQKFLFYIVKGFVGFFFFRRSCSFLGGKKKKKEKKRRRVVLTWVGVERKKVGICH